MTKTPEELTEDWKAGELEYGQYWVKNKAWEKPFIDRWLPSCSWEISCKDAIEQILAPVPTYDEYKAMQAELAELKEKVADQRTDLESARWYQTVQNEDIGKLRGLLKECLPIVSAEIMTWQIRGGEESHKRGQDLLTRINAALGESEER